MWQRAIRCIVIPATQKIYMEAMEEGLLKTFIEAGAVVSTPTCGPCLGGYMGILAAGRALCIDHEPELCGTYGACQHLRFIWRARQLQQPAR